MENMSRRSFVAGAAAVALAAATPAIAEEAARVIAETIDTDVVVMGGGSAGTTAARQAFDLGAKVVLVERQGQLSGKAMYTGGIFAVDSDQQKAAGVTLTLKEMYDDYMKSTAYMADSAMVQRYFATSGETVSWLGERGMIFTLTANQQVTHEEKYTVYHTWPTFGTGFNAGAVDDYNNYVKPLADAGCPILLNTRGIELLTDADGNIAGMICERKDGSFIQINAKVVILAGGGWGGNPEIQQKFSFAGTKIDFKYDTNNTGDSQTMAWAIGAREGNWANMLHAILPPLECPMERICQAPLRSVGALWVNRSGIRFTNEEATLDSAFGANVVAAQRDDIFSIVDQAFVEATEKGGGIALGLDVSSVTSFVNSPVDEPWENLQASLEEAVADGGVFIADTLEELAQEIGIVPTTLINTVDTYNSMVDAGFDSMFGKNPQYLVEIKTGPFYAIRGRALSLCGIGGIHANSNFEVLRPDGSVIKGLYAAGADVAGIYNNTYPEYEGVALGFAFNSGRIAGMSAAAYLGL